MRFNSNGNKIVSNEVIEKCAVSWYYRDVAVFAKFCCYK